MFRKISQNTLQELLLSRLLKAVRIKTTSNDFHTKLCLQVLRKFSCRCGISCTKLQRELRKSDLKSQSKNYLRVWSLKEVTLADVCSRCSALLQALFIYNKRMLVKLAHPEVFKLRGTGGDVRRRYWLGWDRQVHAAVLKNRQLVTIAWFIYLHGGAATADTHAAPAAFIFLLRHNSNTIHTSLDSACITFPKDIIISDVHRP